MHEHDTIAARATPPGLGGVAVVRLSGRQALAVLKRVFVSTAPQFTHFRPWTLHRGRIVDSAGLMLDDGLAVFMPGPRTFTGEDVVEIHCHGSPVITQAILENLLAHGARLAEPGEFSRRAFLHGRMDLTQVEAIAEMVAAPTTEALRLTALKLDGVLGKRAARLRELLEQARLQMCVAVDFPEDEVECLAPHDFAAQVRHVIDALDSLLQGYARARGWHEGMRVVLVGAVNAGKSSLMNALLGHNRALVTPVPGTTRDFLEETVVLDGLSVRLTDTAGLRQSHDPVEQLGIAHSCERMDRADALLLVLDGALGHDAVASLDAALMACHNTSAISSLDILRRAPVILVWNKADIAPTPHIPKEWRESAVDCVTVSALHGQGLETLCASVRDALVQHAGGEPEPGAPNTRQATALAKAREELIALHTDILEGQPYDICSVRLDAATAWLGEVTGVDAPAAVLDKVFATLCIGK